MIKNIALSTAAAVALGFGASQGQAAQLLLNGSFESPAVSAGNHVGTLPDNWTVLNASGAVNSAGSNLFSGTSTDTTNGNTVVLGPDPYDTANTNNQSLDIDHNGSAYQLFSSQANAPVTIKIDFGGRSSIARTTDSFWTLYDSTGTTVIASGATVVTGNGTWTTQTTTTPVSLVAGTQYRFQITLDDADQVDGITINQVPEPTTLTMAGFGLGLLGWVGFQHRSKKSQAA